jgi:hypothetical protein
MSDPLAHFPQISLRIADALHERLVEAAQANHQSLNAEIIARLESSFAEGADRSAMSLDRRALIERMHRLEDLADEASRSADA